MKSDDEHRAVHLLSELLKCVEEISQFASKRSYTISAVTDPKLAKRAGFRAASSQQLNDLSALIHRAFLGDPKETPYSVAHEEEFNTLISELNEHEGGEHIAGIFKQLFEQTKLLELKSFRARRTSISTSRKVHRLIQSHL